MTYKAQAQITYCWQKIAEGTFDQETIGTLLINLRDFVANNSFTRELGDFIAHPERDRGIALSHVTAFSFEIVNGTWQFRLPMPWDGRKLIDELEQCFLKLAAKGQENEITSTLTAHGNDILLCYLGILHYATLHKKEKGSSAKLVGLLLAKPMGGEQNLSAVIRMQGRAEIPLITTKLSASDKVSFDVKELDDNNQIMAVRGEDGLKLRRITK